MSTSFDQMSFQPPPSFVLEEALLTCGAVGDEVATTSLIARSVKAPEGSHKASLFEQFAKSLERAGAGMLQEWDAAPFRFADGYEGKLITCQLSLHGQALRQFHALRFDDGMLTSLALTLRGDGPAAQEQALLKALASAVAG